MKLREQASAASSASESGLRWLSSRRPAAHTHVLIALDIFVLRPVLQAYKTALAIFVAVDVTLAVKLDGFLRLNAMRIFKWQTG
jgi:hypothetical protein